MNRYSPICIHVSVLMITVLLVLAFCLLLGRTSHAAVSTSTSDLVQFTASGHILGFESEGVYVASGDHMLRVEFEGTGGVKPVTEKMPAGDGHAEPLGRVDYPELWPGISLSYEAVSGGIVQSSYLLEPGADVGQILLRYNASVEISAGGSLRIAYESGWISESAPVAWQEIDGRRISVKVVFSLYDSSTKNAMVGFSLGQHNPAYPLAIDPTLSWNTFMGSTSDDSAYAIAVDFSGNVYLAGSSYATWGSPVNTHAGGEDAFIAKLNSSGVLQWNTFIGSVSGGDLGSAIVVDNSGNVYVTGWSEDTWGSPVNTYAGGFYDAFVAKLNNNGVLQWNTFMGSAFDEQGHAILVDGSGNVYVAGFSSGTWGSPVNAYTGDCDAFVAKLNNSGVLQWNTFMGSASLDFGTALAIDSSGNVYIAGRSKATWGSPVNPHAGGDDAFAAKLNSSGVLQWNTFMGSTSDSDWGFAIAVDNSEKVYVAGWSYAWGLPVNPHTGSTDIFVTKLNNSGDLQWNTFMGSASLDIGTALAIDGSENVYVTGWSKDTWGSPVNPHAGGDDAFAAKLNSSGVLQWNTFMGSASDDRGYGIVVDSNRKVYIAGYSEATWNSPVNAHAGDKDAFVANLSASTITKIMTWIPLLLLGD